MCIRCRRREWGALANVSNEFDDSGYFGTVNQLANGQTTIIYGSEIPDDRLQGVEKAIRGSGFLVGLEGMVDGVCRLVFRVTLSAARVGFAGSVVFL